jgi:hypothetical protein
MESKNSLGDLVVSTLLAAQRHADRFGVQIPVLIVSPSGANEAAPSAVTTSGADGVVPTGPVPVPPPDGIHLEGPQAAPDRPVARARYAKGNGTTKGKIKHEVPGRNIKEFFFNHKNKSIKLTLADVITPQGNKTSAYVGTAFVCDFAQTPSGAACILRHPGRGKRVETSEPIPAEYRGFYVCDYRTATGYTGSGVPESVWCVVVPSGDSASTAAVAIRRWLAAR